MIIVSNVKDVDLTILSIDQDNTVCITLKMIAEKYSSEFELAFASVGDQNNASIPEKSICEEIDIIF